MASNMIFFYPDRRTECRICGTLPTVTAGGHKVPQTQLCGFHFFDAEEMKNWENWNDGLVANLDNQESPT